MSPSTPQGTPRDLRVEIYRLMRLARTLNERLFILNRQGKVSAAVSVQGHEAAQVGSALAFERGADVFLPYYRDYGVVLALGITPAEVLLNHLSRAGDPNSAGRSAPCHWGARRLGIMSRASPVASQIPEASGIAWALRYRREPRVRACWFGDGATSAGDFHEGLNFAAIHRLPVVFICENNEYAISVPRERQMAVVDVAVRAAGYGCLNRDVRVKVTMAGVERVLDSPFAFFVPASVEHCFVTLKADTEAYVLGILLEHLREGAAAPEQGRTPR